MMSQVLRSFFALFLLFIALPGYMSIFLWQTLFKCKFEFASLLLFIVAVVLSPFALLNLGIERGVRTWLKMRQHHD
jgi:hypothetical protein